MKKNLIALLFLVIIIISKISLGDEEYDNYGNCISGCTTFTPNNPNSFDWENGKLNTVPSDKLNFDKIQQYGREKDLMLEQLAYKDSSGNTNINKIKDWNKLNKEVRNKALSKLTGKEVVTDEPVNGRVVDNGIQFDSIKFLRIDKTSITNAAGVIYDGSKLKFKSADSVLTDNSISTNVLDFESYEDSFFVEKADSFLSDCLRVDSIKDSEFKVSNKVEITTKSDVNLKITDCSYNEVTFSGKGRVAIDKTQNPIYILENGTLTKTENGYNESVESNNSIIVETDKTFGFKCLTITPVGSYFYNDNDLRKDFVVNIPKESSTYKLCLRKNQIQQFKDYNGLVDFVDKKIELNGIVNYLRYPLKNNQIASLLSDFVYKGLKNVKTLLVLDKDLLFLNNAEIKNVLQNKQQVTITKPNNYYNIKEMELEDGKIHRIVELNQLNKNQLTQDINYNYESDSLKPKVKISNNILVHDNGKNSITFLPPEHERINQIIK